MLQVTRRRSISFIGLAALVTMLLANAAVAGPRPVTVFAAASLGPVMEAISLDAQRRGLAECRCVFAASSVLARQIVNGAPADIYMSANRRWMDYLDKTDGLAPGTLRIVARNRLALAAPAIAPFQIELSAGADLAAALDGGWLAMGDPDHVPAGMYGKAALSHLGLWQQVTGRVAAAANVRAALALVERGEAAAGVVYESDLHANAKVVLAGRFPAASHAPVVYMAAMIGRQPRPEARRFFDYLSSPPAQAIFRAHGLRPAGGSGGS